MKPKVLFLCTHNSARSQMAEAFLHRHAGDRFEVYSAGLEPSDIYSYTRKVMEEVGYDLSGHYSKGLKQWLGKVHFGYLITVCGRAEAECPIFPGMGKRLHWPFDDPTTFEGTEEQRLQRFREVRDAIEARVLAWLQEEEAP